jgi:hypothetical protein
MGAHKRSATRRPVTACTRQAVHSSCMCRTVREYIYSSNIEFKPPFKCQSLLLGWKTETNSPQLVEWAKWSPRASPALYSPRAKFAKSFAGASGDKSRARGF